LEFIDIDKNPIEVLKGFDNVDTEIVFDVNDLHFVGTKNKKIIEYIFQRHRYM